MPPAAAAPAAKKAKPSGAKAGAKKKASKEGAKKPKESAPKKAAAKDGAKAGAAKPKKRSKKSAAAGDAAKRKSKTGGARGKTPPVSPSPTGAPAAPQPKIGSRDALMNRTSTKIGGRSGIDWAALDRAAKEESKVNYGSSSPFMSRKKKEEEHSKIYKALNPDKLWKESARERAEAQDDDNVMVVQVRGSDARTLLDQHTFVRDDTGAIVESEDEDLDGFGVAYVESGTIGFDEMEGILADKRREREAEAQKHREELRKVAEAKAAEEKKRIEEEQKAIEKKEALLRRQQEKEEVDVAEVQKRLEKEMDFQFGFDAVDDLYAD